MKQVTLLLGMFLSIAMISSCSEKKKKYEPKNGDFQITLEVDEYKVVDLLSDNNQSPIFRAVLDKAQERHVVEGAAFLDAFYNEWINQASNCDQPLRNFFCSSSYLQYRLEECCDSDVISILEEEIIIGMKSTIKIIEDRLFGVGFDEYQILPVENTFSIQIVLSPNIDRNRAIRLITSPGRLGLFETYNNKEISPKMDELLGDTIYKSNGLVLLSNGTAVVGFTAIKDTSSVNRLLSSETAKRVFPDDLKLMWGTTNETDTTGQSKLNLYALHVEEPYGWPLIDEKDIQEAKTKVDKNGRPFIFLKLNTDGCRKYSLITGRNKGKELIIEIDDVVYSIFTVDAEEMDGRINFYCDFNLEESKDLTQIIIWGSIPLPLKIANMGFI